MTKSPMITALLALVLGGCAAGSATPAAGVRATPARTAWQRPVTAADDLPAVRAVGRGWIR